MTNKKLLNKLTINGEEYISLTGLVDYFCEEFALSFSDKVCDTDLDGANCGFAERIRYYLHTVGRDDLAERLVRGWVAHMYPFTVKEES